MEGIKGLELISTQIDSMRIEHIGIVLIIPILFFITSIAIIIRGVRDKDIKDRMSIVVTGLLLMAMTLIMGTMFTKAFYKSEQLPAQILTNLDGASFQKTSFKKQSFCVQGIPY